MKRYFLMLAALLTASHANAEIIDGSRFSVGAWSGNAYYNNDTGNWSHCAVGAQYPNGFNLDFSLNAEYQLGLFLTHTSKPVFANSESFQVVTNVDNFSPMFGTVTPLDSYTAGLWYTDLDTAINQFKKGNSLTISSQLGTEIFGLRGTFKALESAYECARTYQDFSVPQYQAPTNRAVQIGTWEPTAFDTNAMYQLATLLISDFGLKDFEYSTPNEKVVPGSVQFRANNDTILGIVAVGREVGDDLDLNEIMAEDLANITSKYCGDGDMAIINSTREIDGITSKYMKGLCDHPSNAFTAYLTKQVISNRLVETILMNYGEVTVSGTHSDTPAENSAIIAARFVKYDQ